MTPAVKDDTVYLTLREGGIKRLQIMNRCPEGRYTGGEVKY